MTLVCKKGFNEAELITSCFDESFGKDDCGDCLCKKCEYWTSERCSYDCLDEVEQMCVNVAGQRSR